MKYFDRKTGKRRKWAIFDFQYDSDLMDSFVNNGEPIEGIETKKPFSFLKLFEKIKKR